MRTMKKQVVLLLSRVFPIYHTRKGQQTGFFEAISHGEKVHTIRAGYDRWKHNLDKVVAGDFQLSLREWSGKPYNSRQVERLRYGGDTLGYQRISMAYDPVSDDLKVVIDGRRFTDLETLAHNDGLSLDDFKCWMFGATKSTDKQLFQGIIIHFTDFRY